MNDDGRPINGAGDDLEPAPLSPQEEAAVHNLLAALPDPQIPTDVERRISQALGTASHGTTPTAATVATGPPEIGPPTTILAARAPSGRWRHPRLLQAAAAIIVVGLVGAVTANVFTGGDNNHGTVTAAPENAVGPITTSGATYTPTTLPTQVLGLLGAGAGAPSPAQPQAASSGSNAATTLVQNQAKRQACIDQLAGTPGVRPVAIDVGMWSGKPAAIIVLPNENNAAQVDVWVVGSTCSDADRPFPYQYARVTRP